MNTLHIRIFLLFSSYPLVRTLTHRWQKEVQHPTQTKKKPCWFFSCYTFQSRQRCPAVLGSFRGRQNCYSSSHSRGCRFCQFSSCQSHLLQQLLLQWKLSAHAEGKSRQQKAHTGKRGISSSTRCSLPPPQQVSRKNCMNTEVSCYLKILIAFMSFLTLSLLPLFLQVGEEGKRRRIPVALGENQKEKKKKKKQELATLIEDSCQRQEHKRWLVKSVFPHQKWCCWPWEAESLENYLSFNPLLGVMEKTCSCMRKVH